MEVGFVGDDVAAVVGCDSGDAGDNNGWLTGGYDDSW